MGASRARSRAYVGCQCSTIARPITINLIPLHKAPRLPCSRLAVPGLASPRRAHRALPCRAAAPCQAGHASPCPAWPNRARPPAMPASPATARHGPPRLAIVPRRLAGPRLTQPDTRAWPCRLGLTTPCPAMPAMPYLALPRSASPHPAGLAPPCLTSPRRSPTQAMPAAPRPAQTRQAAPCLASPSPASHAIPGRRAAPGLARHVSPATPHRRASPGQAWPCRAVPAGRAVNQPRRRPSLGREGEITAAGMMSRATSST